MRLFILLTFLFSNFETKSQNYIGFPDSNVVWCAYRVFLMYNAPDTSEIHVYTYQQTIGNDTLINGLDYNNIFESGEFYWEAWPMPFYFGNLTYLQNRVGSIREDNKIIYIVPPNSSVEYVLYDFNINVGDTVNFFNSGGYTIVTSIDSVYDSMVYRKRFNISTADTSLWIDPIYHEYVSIIEGIGSTHGLLWTLDPYNPEVGGQLLAFKENGLVLYPDTSLSCEVTTTPEIPNRDNDILLYPNPTNSELSLEVNAVNIQINKIEFYNIYGQKINLQTEKMKSNRFKTNTTILTPGTYFLVIEGVNHNYVRKFIKANN